MASRRLADLHPRLAELCQQHLDLCAASGVRVLLTCTWRSPDEQRALYAQGRLPLDVVNAMRLEVGLGALTDAENRHTVTRRRAGSKHNHTTPDGRPCALAYDCVPLDDAGHPDWSETSPRWATVGDVGTRLGLVWGGDWPQRDCPHFQLRDSEA